MSENNKRNGKIAAGIGAAGLLTVAGWAYTDIKGDIREGRKEVAEVRALQAKRGERIGVVEIELKSLRAERERQISVRDKELADMKMRLDKLERK